MQHPARPSDLAGCMTQAHESQVSVSLPLASVRCLWDVTRRGVGLQDFLPLATETAPFSPGADGPGIFLSGGESPARVAMQEPGARLLAGSSVDDLGRQSTTTVCEGAI